MTNNVLLRVAPFLFFLLIYSDGLQAQTLPPCPFSGACGENYICHGDFEFFTSYHAEPLSTNVGSIFVINNNPIIASNTPDLYSTTVPASFNLPTSNLFTYYCGPPTPTNQIKRIPPLPHQNSGVPNENYLGFVSGGSTFDRTESITFALNAPLNVGGKYKIRFYVAAPCAGDIDFTFSIDPPCTSTMYQSPANLPPVIHCANGTNYVPLQHIDVPTPNTLNGQNFTWVQVEEDFTAQYAAEHLVIQPGLIPTYQLTYMIDDVELIRIDPELDVSVVASDDKPCLGDDFLLTYTICNNTSLNLAVPMDFQLNLPPNYSINSASVVPGAGHGINGNIATINGLAAGDCVDLTVEVNAGMGLTPFVPTFFELITLSGACITGGPVETEITPGLNTLVVTKNVTSSGPFIPGATVTYEVTVDNTGTYPIFDIIIEDQLPPELTALGSAPAGLNFLAGNSLITTDPFDVGLGQSTSFTYQVVINPSALPCQPIENCAVITDASKFCGQPQGCATITIDDPNPVTLGTFPAAYASCATSCDATLNVTHNGGIGPFNYTITPIGTTTNCPNAFSTTTPVFNGLGAGPYNLLIDDLGSYCQYNFTVNVLAPQPLGFASTSISDASCFGFSDGHATLQASGGTGPYAYQWSNGQSGHQATNLAAGGYQVTVTDANGCTEVLNVNINEPAELTYTWSITDATCLGGCDGQITVSPTGGTSPFEIIQFQNIGGVSTPNYTGLTSLPNLCEGGHTINVSDANGCLGNIGVTLMVGNNQGSAFWHQTTFSADGGDQGHDVVVDDEGSVYITGEFLSKTNFQAPPVMIQTGYSSNPGMYVAKYDDCGNFQWVGHSKLGSISDHAKGLAIALDEENDWLYIAGTFDQISGGITFTTGSGIPSSSPTAAYGMFVTKLDLQGNILQTWDLFDRENTPTAMEVGSNGNLFICGNYKDGITTRAFALEFDPASGNQVHTPQILSHYGITATDIALDAHDNFYITGTFEDQLYFLNTTGVVYQVSVPAVPDGYIARFNYINSTTPPSNPWLRVTGAQTGTATLNSVEVDASGHSVVAGTTDGNLNNYFNSGANYTNNGGGNNIIVARLRSDGAWDPNVSWWNNSVGAIASSSDLSIDNNFLWLTGGFQGGLLNLQNTTATGLPFSGGSAGRIHVSKLNPADGQLLSLDADVGSSTSNAEAICSNNTGSVFTLGHYQGTLQLNGGSFNTLTSTGTGTNAFVLRSNIPNGNFWRQDVNATIETHQLEVYPNPSNGLIYLKANFDSDLSATIQVYDQLGSLVHQESNLMISNEASPINLHHLSQGLYLIRLEAGQQAFHQKVIIE